MPFAQRNSLKGLTTNLIEIAPQKRFVGLRKLSTRFHDSATNDPRGQWDISWDY